MEVTNLTGGGSLVTLVMGLAASLLALAVLVQVIQEIYKYLTNSKSRAYHLALRDFLGPWSMALLQKGKLNDLKMRGPFQIHSRSPRQWLLPLPVERLQTALEATTPAWCQRVLQALQFEVSIGVSGPPSSPSWKSLVTQLEAAVKEGGPGNNTAQELLDFVKRWTESSVGSEGPAALLTAFRAKFLPHVDSAVNAFPQLMQQFDFAYRRRNLRQTFILGFLVALIGGFPIGALYQKASRLTPEEARALAQAATALADSAAVRVQPAPAPGDSAAAAAMATTPAQADSNYQRASRDLKAALKLLSPDSTTGAPPIADFAAIWRYNWPDKFAYLAGCLITALLLSFGAPFWNDLTKSLMKIQQERDQPLTTSVKSE